jgi:hypothetical protein
MVRQAHRCKSSSGRALMRRTVLIIDDITKKTVKKRYKMVNRLFKILVSP